MLRKGQTVIIADTLTSKIKNRAFANKVRGKYATVKSKVETNEGYFRLTEYPGYMFHERFLIPIDDNDAAFARFMNSLKLDSNPWTETQEQ